MAYNQIDSAWLSQGNVIFIKQLGTKTKQHSRIEAMQPNSHPDTHDPVQLTYFRIFAHK